MAVEWLLYALFIIVGCCVPLLLALLAYGFPWLLPLMAGLALRLTLVRTSTPSQRVASPGH
jgi:hypothetical protein